MIFAPRFVNDPEIAERLRKMGVSNVFDMLASAIHDVRHGKPLTLSPQEASELKGVFTRISFSFFNGEEDIETLHSRVRNFHAQLYKTYPSGGDFCDARMFHLVFRSIPSWLHVFDSIGVNCLDKGVFEPSEVQRQYLVKCVNDPIDVLEAYIRNFIKNRDVPYRKYLALVDVSIYRVGLKQISKNIDWCRTLNDDHIRHIFDWLEVSLKDKAPWLENVDTLGRPKKLMKFGSIQAMHAEADKQMRRKLSSQRKQLGSDDEEVIASDGPYRLVRLKTPRALRHEGAEMRHCVGLGAYDRKLEREGYLILSLRNSKAASLATLEIEGNRVIQFMGKANGKPSDEHRDVTERLLKKAGLRSIAGSEASDRLERALATMMVDQVPYFSRDALATPGHL